MNNKEYADLVNQGQFPEDNMVAIDPPFVDQRGEITNVWLGPSNSVSLITSKKGSSRASHWHQNDWHGAYVISGELEYFERDIDGTNVKEPIIVKAGEMVFSKPNVVHKMLFMQDTVFITVNGIIKDHSGYENSVHRVEF